MKKIITSLLLSTPVLAFAQTGAVGTTTQVTTSTSTQIECVKMSLDKRENALIAGHDAFAASIKTALQKRLEGLKMAWSETDKKVRQAKRLETWKAFKTDSQAGNTALRGVRNGAWKMFDTDMKACGIKGHGEAPMSISAPNTSL